MNIKDYIYSILQRIDVNNLGIYLWHVGLNGLGTDYYHLDIKNQEVARMLVNYNKLWV